MWKANSAELWRCPIVHDLHAGGTPVGVSAYGKHAAGNSLERKKLYRGHQSKVVKCLLWWVQLYLHSETLSLLFFFLPCFLSRSASPDIGATSPFFPWELQLTCLGLKGICSARQVCIIPLFLWPLETVKYTEKHIYTHCSVAVVPVKSQGSVIRTFHMSGCWIEQED